MGKILAVTSGKGGTGKSTVCAGLAMAFASQKKNVLMIDMDEGLRCLDLMLGIESDIVFDLSDILSGRETDDAIYTSPKNKFLNLIPAPTKPGEIEAEPFRELIEKLATKYDVVLVDFPAGIDFSLYSCLGDEAHFVTICNPDPISVRDAAVVCNSLPKTHNVPVFILNKFVYEVHKRGLYENIDNIIDETGFRLQGIIPNSNEMLMLSVIHSLKRRGRAFKALSRISRRLLGENVRLPKFTKI